MKITKNSRWSIVDRLWYLTDLAAKHSRRAMLRWLAECLEHVFGKKILPAATTAVLEGLRADLRGEAVNWALLTVNASLAESECQDGFAALFFGEEARMATWVAGVVRDLEQGDTYSARANAARIAGMSASDKEYRRRIDRLAMILEEELK
jgi:hypothetical protein